MHSGSWLCDDSNSSIYCPNKKSHLDNSMKRENCSSSSKTTTSVSNRNIKKMFLYTWFMWLKCTCTFSFREQNVPAHTHVNQFNAGWNTWGLQTFRRYHSEHPVSKTDVRNWHFRSSHTCLCRSKQPLKIFTNIRYFYLKADDFLKKNGCSERTTTLDVRNGK